MEGKNYVQLVGYVGQDLKETKGDHGLRVAIRLATHHYMTDGKDGKLYKTTWHNVIAWDEQAVYAIGNIVKGSHILVEGKMGYAAYTGADGHKRTSTRIRAVTILNLGR